MGFALASHLLWSCLSLGVSLWTFVFIIHPPHFILTHYYTIRRNFSR